MRRQGIIDRLADKLAVVFSHQFLPVRIPDINM
jgi:hypothetical protein